MIPEVALYGLLASLLTPLARGEYEFPSVAPTTYYDNLWDQNGNVCGAQYGANWNELALSTSMCEWDFSPATVMSLYKTNQIVAIDNRMLNSPEGRQKYCGKKVKVYKPDGSEYVSGGGDLYVWDGCQACADANGGIVDFSAPDYLSMTGSGANQCAKGEQAFRVVVTDENVIPPTGNPPDAPSGKDTFNCNGPCPAGEGQAPVAPSAAAPTSGTASQGAWSSAPAAGAPSQSQATQWSDPANTAGAGAGAGAGTWSSAPAVGAPQNPAVSSSANNGQWNGNTAGAGAPTADAPGGPGAPGTNAGQQGGAGAGAPGAVNFAAESASTSSAASGVQPAASGVADISAGNCSEGKHRCTDPNIQVCGHNDQGQIDWVAYQSCLFGCQEEQPGSPYCKDQPR